MTQTSFNDYPTEQADAAVPPLRTGSTGATTGTNSGNPPGTPQTPENQQQQQVNAQQEQQRQQVENDYVKTILFDFSQAKPRLMKLRSLWLPEVNNTIERRLYRKVDLSPKRLRDDAKLKPDETIIPDRVIDTNIRQEAPAYVNYVISPNRAAIFHCLDNESVDSQTTQNMEKDFTTGTRFPGWEFPMFKVIDGAQLHGWDSTEVVYDETKPLHVADEHIAHDNLWFSVDALDLQACELLMRRFSVSAMQLRNWIKNFGFDPHQTQMCLDVIKGIDKADFNFCIYKVFFKWQGVVYVSWACLEFCDNWLKAPQKLKLGISKQVQVMKPTQVPNPKFGMINQIGSAIGLVNPEPPMITTMMPTMEWQEQDIVDYPVFLNIYLLTEEQPIMMAVGRGFLDKYIQEAKTAIGTGFVNGLNRASNIYGSVDGDPSSTAEPQQLKTALNNGAIYDRKINFFHTDYPDPQCLQALQYWDTKGAQQAGQLEFAANNREDSRKTAQEIKAAESAQTQLSTVQVALFSIYQLKVLNFKWLIIQSQALQNKIAFLQIPQPQLGPDGQQTLVMVNNNDLISKRYLLRPAGSVDVVERQQMLQQMRQDWPVISQTPLVTEFFKEFIRQAYPNQANAWIAILDQAQQTKQLVQVLATMLQHMVMTHPGDISPQDKQTLLQVQQQVQQFLQPNAPVQQGQQSPQGNGQVKPDSNNLAGISFNPAQNDNPVGQNQHTLNSGQ